MKIKIKNNNAYFLVFFWSYDKKNNKKKKLFCLNPKIINDQRICNLNNYASKNVARMIIQIKATGLICN